MKRQVVQTSVSARLGGPPVRTVKPAEARLDWGGCSSVINKPLLAAFVGKYGRNKVYIKRPGLKGRQLV